MDITCSYLSPYLRLVHNLPPKITSQKIPEIAEPLIQKIDKWKEWPEHQKLWNEWMESSYPRSENETAKQKANRLQKEKRLRKKIRTLVLEFGREEAVFLFQAHAITVSKTCTMQVFALLQKVHHHECTILNEQRKNAVLLLKLVFSQENSDFRLTDRQLEALVSPWHECLDITFHSRFFLKRHSKDCVFVWQLATKTPEEIKAIPKQKARPNFVADDVAGALEALGLSLGMIFPKSVMVAFPRE